MSDDLQQVIDAEKTTAEQDDDAMLVTVKLKGQKLRVVRYVSIAPNKAANQVYVVFDCEPTEQRFVSIEDIEQIRFWVRAA